MNEWDDRDDSNSTLARLGGARPSHGGRNGTAAGYRFGARERSPYMNILDLDVTTIDGRTTRLAEFAADVTLIVNVASRCGFTPQYEALEHLQESYGDRGFTVLGFPSNQFFQELGSTGAIQEFCDREFGVTFPLFSLVRVNGRRAHPLFKALTKTADPDGKAGRVRWNFEKFLLLPDGTIRRFRSKVEPDDPAIVALIEASLPRLGTVKGAARR